MSKAKAPEAATTADPINSAFGIPPAGQAPKADAPAVAQSETDEQRIARLRAAAAAQVARESDEQMLARFVAEERARVTAALPPDDTVLPIDTQGFPKDYSVVHIFKGRDKHDLAYVPLGINGFTIKCPRGVDVILPTCFVTECLEHAIEEITIQSQGGLITRPAHRFPFNVKRKATEEEYRAFQKQQIDLAARQTAAAAVAAA